MEVESLHPEWDLMYRKGLPYGLIAKLCKAPRSTVHLHLQRQAARYPALQEEHERNRPPLVMTSPPIPRKWLDRYEELKTLKSPEISLR